MKSFSEINPLEFASLSAGEQEKLLLQYLPEATEEQINELSQKVQGLPPWDDALDIWENCESIEPPEQVNTLLDALYESTKDKPMHISYAEVYLGKYHEYRTYVYIGPMSVSPWTMKLVCSMLAERFNEK